MKKRILILFLLVFSSSAFTQNIKMSVSDSLLSLKLQEKGITAGRLGDFEEAINQFDQLYNVRLDVYGSSSYKLASPLVNMGIQYKNLRNLDKAIEVYKRAEQLYIAEYGEDYAVLGIVFTNIGNIYGLNGDYNKALEYHRNAFRILKRDSLHFNEIFQVSKYNVAETQLKLGYNSEAIRFAQLNLKATLPFIKPGLCDLIALAYRNEGEFELSEKYYLKAIKSWIDLYGDDNVELVSEYLAYSSFLMSQKSYEKALIYSTKAKSIVLKFYGEKSTSYAEVQSNFGDYYYLKNSDARQMDDFRVQRKKNLDEAIQYYQNAIVSLVDSFQVKDPFVDPPLKNVISEIQLVEEFKKKAVAMEKLADIYLSEFDYKKSLKYYVTSLNSLTKATQLIYRLQIGFENEDSKLFLAQNQESTFQEAIKIAYKLYNQTRKAEYIEKAFEFSERSKSSNLLASIKDVKAKEFGGIPDSLLKQENYLKSNVANYTSMLFEENHSEKPDSQKVNLFSAKIFKFNDEYNRLIDSFEKLYPRYYAFKYENKVVGIQEIQSKISARQALVEFFVKEPEAGASNGELYRFVITRDSATFTKENIDYSYVENIQSVHDFLTNPNFLYTKKKDFIDYSVAAYGLYEKLLKPVYKKINGKNLTIIPHDKLSYIPFDALLSQLPDTSVMNFRNLNYLVRDYAINYSYSATLLYDYFSQKKTSTKSLMVFSPEYVANEPRTDTESSNQYFFNPLPGAKDEVKGISRYVKSDSFVDMLAQENTFKEKASEYDILHLAMHTIINDSLPMFSKLVFSKPGQNSTDDGYLNTYEIYNLKLNARLAVLSACETGTGKLQKGEGVMSMARGFIYAGCPSIVMTLWQVEDKSGVKIMDDFYYYLSKGKRKDVALRMAKLKHLNNSDPLTAHPHFWLGYVSIGNPEPLYTSKDMYFVIFLFVAALLVFADWYIRKRPGKKQGRI
ncbi:MAG TPA: CHAT domain-containing tetratricopeptide repeat protein [Prolixibacteraceae bacterium]|nr:CHAT domain-containing tetratricopeptide repeat protein [Prolixibacteraceae bacterium]